MRNSLCTGALVALMFSGSAAAVESKGALYADLRWSLDYTDDDSAAPGPTYTATDNHSIWGVKASTSQGGVTVWGNYERFVDDDSAGFFGLPLEVTRQAYIGITSFCGVLRVGRFATAYAEAGRKLDPFFKTAVSGIGGLGNLGGAIAGNSHGSSTPFNADQVGAAIVPNHLAYETPTLLGLTANVAFFADESGTANQDHDYGGGLQYDGNGITAGAQFLNDNNGQWGAVDEDATRLYGGYTASNWGAGASWESVHLPGADDGTYLMVSGWYGLNPATRLALSYGNERDTPAPGESLRLGVFYDLIENFTIWAAAMRYDYQLPHTTALVAVQPDSDVVTIGASYKFNLGFTASH